MYFLSRDYFKTTNKLFKEVTIHFCFVLRFLAWIKTTRRCYIGYFYCSSSDTSFGCWQTPSAQGIQAENYWFCCWVLFYSFSVLRWFTKDSDKHLKQHKVDCRSIYNWLKSVRQAQLYWESPPFPHTLPDTRKQAGIGAGKGTAAERRGVERTAKHFRRLEYYSWQWLHARLVSRAAVDGAAATEGRPARKAGPGAGVNALRILLGLLWGGRRDRTAASMNCTIEWMFAWTSGLLMLKEMSQVITQHLPI